MFTVHLSLSVDEDDVLVHRLLLFAASPRHAPLHVIHGPNLANLGQYQTVFLILKSLMRETFKDSPLTLYMLSVLSSASVVT